VDCNWIIVDRFHLFVKWSSVLTTEVDAFLYLGPQDLRLKEKLPADIALDEDYRSESQKEDQCLGFPECSLWSAGGIWPGNCK